MLLSFQSKQVNYMATVAFKRIDHVSLTVQEIEPIVQFYTEVSGADSAYRKGPFDAAKIHLMEDGRDWTEAHINVPGARLEIAMLNFSDDPGMELFLYEKPEDARQPAPRNCDIGWQHLCIEVENLDNPVDFLVSKGCTAMAGSIDMLDGPCPQAVHGIWLTHLATSQKLSSITKT